MHVCVSMLRDPFKTEFVDILQWQWQVLDVGMEVLHTITYFWVTPLQPQPLCLVLPHRQSFQVTSRLTDKDVVCGGEALKGSISIEIFPSSCPRGLTWGRGWVSYQDRVKVLIRYVHVRACVLVQNTNMLSDLFWVSPLQLWLYYLYFSHK